MAMKDYGRPVKIVQYRNVIVVGKTGAGKSTVANRVMGCDVFHVADGLFSTCRRTAVHAIECLEHGNVTYRVKMVDTGAPSTFPTKDYFVDNFRAYLKDKCPEGINLVLFVFRKGRFTDEERQTFDVFIKMFRKEVSEFSALVITHCAMGKEGRQSYLHSFASDSRTRNISSFFKKGTYPVDFPPLDEDEDEEPSKKPVLNDVKSLRQLIFSCSQMTLGSDMVE